MNKECKEHCNKQIYRQKFKFPHNKHCIECKFYNHNHIRSLPVYSKGISVNEVKSKCKAKSIVKMAYISIDSYFSLSKFNRIMASKNIPKKRFPPCHLKKFHFWDKKAIMKTTIIDLSGHVKHSNCKSISSEQTLEVS